MFNWCKIAELNKYARHPPYLCTRLTGVPVATRRNRRTHLLPTVGHLVIYGPVLAAEQSVEEGSLACGEGRGWRFQGGDGLFYSYGRKRERIRGKKEAERARERDAGKESDRLTAEGTDQACTARVAKSIKDCFIDLTVRAR